MKVKSEREVAQSCPTRSDPMDCSPPGSSIHGIFQARVLEWGAIAFSEKYPNNLYGGGRKFLSFLIINCSAQFSSVAQSCPTVCDPMNHSTPGLPVHHHLPGFTQTHVHRVGDAILIMLVTVKPHQFYNSLFQVC